MIEPGTRGERLARPVERLEVGRVRRPGRQRQVAGSRRPPPLPRSRRRDPGSTGTGAPGRRGSRRSGRRRAARRSAASRCRGGSRRRGCATRSPVRRRDRVGGDGGVVEEAVAAVHRPRGVVAGRPAQAVGGGRAAIEDEVDRGQRDVDRTARGNVRAGDERAPPSRGPRSPPGRRRARARARAGRSRPALMPSNMARLGYVSALRNGRGIRCAAQLRPGDLEEAHEPLVVDGRDRPFAVLGGFRSREAAVRVERGPDASRRARRPRWPGPGRPCTSRGDVVAPGASASRRRASGPRQGRGAADDAVVGAVAARIAARDLVADGSASGCGRRARTTRARWRLGPPRRRAADAAARAAERGRPRRRPPSAP